MEGRKQENISDTWSYSVFFSSFKDQKYKNLTAPFKLCLVLMDLHWTRVSQQTNDHILIYIKLPKTFPHFVESKAVLQTDDSPMNPQLLMHSCQAHYVLISFTWFIQFLMILSPPHLSSLLLSQRYQFLDIFYKWTCLWISTLLCAGNDHIKINFIFIIPNHQSVSL